MNKTTQTQAATAIEKETQIVRGSGNVFADLGLPNPQELQLKARLTHRIDLIVQQRHWTQKKAAGVLGIKQPDVSALLSGKRLEHYSVERLLHFLGRLEQQVTITVSSDDLPPEQFVIGEGRANPGILRL